MKFGKLNCSAKFYSENNDSNLMKVKLMIVHPGRNRNYSSISRETINDAMESVKNIPILGYVKRDDNGDILVIKITLKVNDPVTRISL